MEDTMEDNYIYPMPSEPQRKLAYVRKIDSIKPILSNTENVVATIDGWSVAIKPDEFKEGDLILFIEIDAFLPATDERFHCNNSQSVQTYKGKTGYRVQTRIYGSGKNKILSQGRIFAVKDFPEVDSFLQELRDCLDRTRIEEARWDDMLFMFYEDWDFAKYLGIVKWEENGGSSNSSEENDKGTRKQKQTRLGGFPPLIRKSNHERVQKCPNLFKKAKYKGRTYQESVKMDGASMTVYFVNKESPKYKTLNALPEGPDAVGPNMVFANGRVGVCSHNHELNETDDNMYWEVARALDLPGKLSRLRRNVAIQGELCGAGINRNREGLPAGMREFYVFAIWDIDRQVYFKPREVERRAKDFGLKHVPVLGYVNIREIASCHDDLLQRAARRAGEGLVFKCVEDGRWFKVISNTYLLEHNL